MKQRTLVHLLVLVALSLLCTWPGLVHGLPNLGADAPEHARWTKNFSLQFWQGEWYPRWLSASNGGLGSPVLFVYPPIGDYGATLFRPLLASHDPNGWLVAGWSAVLAGILSAITAYFWLRDLTSPLAALFGAAVYVISPYHLAMSFYNHGALAEYWAFVWMPLILLAAKRCAEGSPWGIPTLAMSFGLLALTHLPTLVCFAWVVPLAAWVLSEPGQRWRAFVRTGVGIALGIGFSAIYVLPARVDEWKSWVGVIADDSWSYYGNNFIFTKLVSPLEYKARVLFLLLSIALVTGILYWLIGRFETDPARRRRALLFLLIGAGALFMTTQLSIPVYKVFRFVQKIQFPRRFAMTMSVALAAMAALAFPLLISKKTPRAAKALVGVMLIGWMGADTWAGATAYSVWRPIPADRAALYARWMSTQREAFAYWPRPADSARLSDVNALEPFLAEHPAHSLVMNPAGGTASVEGWKPRQVTIKVHAPEDGRMTVGHFYYADWRAHIQGSGQNVSVTPSPDGLIEVATPRGDYTLILALEKDTAERAGIWTSGLSLLAICGLAAVAAL